MSSKRIIAISPSGHKPDESSMINRLFEAGLYRYHIQKNSATEQSIAEILEGVEPKFLSQITLHSHYHLVLAYGVGGIHYSGTHRKVMQADYPAKAKLYQSFGVTVSTDIDTEYQEWQPANYALTQTKELCKIDKDVFYVSEEADYISLGNIAIDLNDWLKQNEFSDLPDLLQSYSRTR